MNKPKRTIQPEEIFAEALKQEERELTNRDLNLLVSGLTALREAKNKPLTKNELKSIKSLIAYVVHEQGADEGLVETVLLAEFNAPSLDKIMAKDYQDVVEYLVDLKVEMILN